jgi:dTDP-4-dehydrorhamnose reductase
MRILITGASGMLGASLVEKWQKKFDVYATDKTNFENNSAKKFITFDLLSESYKVLINWSEPDVIVHCAAITNVDYCEEKPKLAMEVNALSVNKFCQSNENVRLIYISSDAVFADGLSMASEKDETSPQNYYGLSKEAGEKYINDISGLHNAIRTTIVGKNINQSSQGFLEWIVNSIKANKEITLFDDAIFCPISIWCLADQLEWILLNNARGIIHIAGIEPISKYEFGRKLCEKLGLDTSLIRRGSIDNVSFKAKRSKDQTMSSKLYQQLSGRKLPSLDVTLEVLVNHFKEFSYE